MNFEEIRGLIKSKLDESNEKKKVYNEAIRKAEAEIEKATDQMHASYDEADVKGYHKAQDAVRTAQDIKEMYSKKLKELEEKKLLQDDEYNTLCNSIRNDIKAAEEETKAKLKELIAELWTICVGYNQNVRDAVSLLHDLQFEIMKDDCCIVSASGVKVFISSKDISNKMRNDSLNLKSFVEKTVDELDRKQGGKYYESWVR